MRVAVGSVKQAPGVTTLAVGLTAMWPAPEAVLVECDPEGGDLAARFGHHPEPGLASLAAACRDGASSQPLAAHVQRLRPCVDVVLAPPGEVAAASVRTLAHAGDAVLRAAGDVVLDVGRLARGGPGMELAATADHVLLVARPSLDELTQVTARLDWLPQRLRGRLWLVVCGAGRYWPTEISRDLGVPVAGQVPHDRYGAGVLSGRLHGPGWRRLQLPRAAGSIALRLSTLDAGGDRSAVGSAEPADRVRVRP